jgi:glycosyltransferase involved in cell wall biosynthesis
LVVRVGGNHDKIFETTGRPLEPRLMRSRKIEKIVEGFVFRRADLVAGANQDNLNFALANGARPERSTLFRYGNLVDVRHFTNPTGRGDGTKVLEELGVEPGKFLLYVGRLEPIKQPDHVLEVLAKLRGEGFDVKAILAGEGRMRDQLEARARQLGVADWLILPGNLSQSALAHLYPAAAAVISPHTGRALSEAALGAAPIVAYDVDWQGEIVETGVTGILVPHGDVGGLAQGAVALVADPVRAKTLGRNIRERALGLLDQEALDQHEREQYSRLLDERR